MVPELVLSTGSPPPDPTLTEKFALQFPKFFGAIDAYLARNDTSLSKIVRWPRTDLHTVLSGVSWPEDGSPNVFQLNSMIDWLVDSCPRMSTYDYAANVLMPVLNQIEMEWRPKRIIFVRHGESEGNVMKRLYSAKPDNQIELTPHGMEQSRRAGGRLRVLIGNEPCVVFLSPYQRAFQTQDNLLAELRRSDDESGALSHQITEVRIEPRLREQDFGNFQDPNDMSTQMSICRDFGRFWYRYPSGESGADVYDRIDGVIDAMVRVWSKRDCSKQNFIVISHGLTIRLLLTRFFKWSPDTFETLYNPDNCAIIALWKCPDMKYRLLDPRPPNRLACDWFAIATNDERKKGPKIIAPLGVELSCSVNTHGGSERYFVAANDRMYKVLDGRRLMVSPATVDPKDCTCVWSDDMYRPCPLCAPLLIANRAAAPHVALWMLLNHLESSRTITARVCLTLEQAGLVPRRATSGASDSETASALPNDGARRASTTASFFSTACHVDVTEAMTSLSDKNSAHESITSIYDSDIPYASAMQYLSPPLAPNPTEYQEYVWRTVRIHIPDYVLIPSPRTSMQELIRLGLHLCKVTIADKVGSNAAFPPIDWLRTQFVLDFWNGRYHKQPGILCEPVARQKGDTKLKISKPSTGKS